MTPGSVGELTAGINAAHRQYSTEGLPRVGYDLSLFDPAARIGNVMDFYGQVIEAGQWSPRRQPVESVAIAT